MNSSVIDRKAGTHSPPHTAGKYRKGRLFFAVALLIFLAAGTAVFLYINSLAYPICRVEAGVEVLASDFIKNGDPEAVFTKGGADFDIHIPGEYRIAVKSGLFTHYGTLIIEDSTPPTAQPSPLVIELGDTCSPEELVADIRDVSPVSAAFASEPDFDTPGVRQVDILLIDQAGNTSLVSSELTVSPFARELSWEAGSSAPTAADFALTNSPGRLVTGISQEVLSHVADVPVTLSSNGQSFPSTLHVVDTVAPVGVVEDVRTCTLAPLEARRFVVSTEDATDVTASFRTAPDMKKPGVQQVHIVLTDEGGNETVLPASLELEEDVTPPVILGAHDMDILEGETVSYRQNVVVEDDFAEEVSLSVDSSGVDTGKAGEYTAVYTASDVSGNRTELRITVTVHPWAIAQDELDQLADEILADTLAESMTELEKVNAIYDYLISSIRYIDHSDKGDWARAAYEGLHDHEGDCYVFASAAKLLLTRAGITNMDIEKSTRYGNHYWNLIDLGDGWYHFDATPRLDHPRIVMWTDRELMRYSYVNGNTHDYDHNQYPNIN